ncbi:MAG: 1,4-alpha-glucan branching enzyme, partial [Chlamydiota bacterium]
MDVTHPHKDLGLQELPSGKKIIRLFRPGSEQVFIEHYAQIVETFPVGHGFFEYTTSASTTKADYRIFHNNGLLAHDPYAFWPTIGPLDEHLFSAGLHYKLYEKMGGRLCLHEGVKGAKFTVWAPSAKSVSLIADFNQWNIWMNPMRAMGTSGIFEIFIPGLLEGHCYKFCIIGPDGQVRIKADPYALAAEMRPLTASKLADVDSFVWTDKARPLKNINGPLHVYEVHLG